MAGNQHHFWGFPQLSYSGPSLCRTVETNGLECGIKPLGASNIGSGNGSKSCSHSARVAVQACTPEKCSNSSLLTRTSSSSSLLIKTSSSSSLLIRRRNSTSLFLRPSGGNRQQELFAAETSTPAIRFQRVFAAPNPPRGLASLKLGTG